MLIDWFTVVAQAINFLILMWLMKRFLYRPILDAIDAREKRIAAELADAAAKKAESLQERSEFQRKNDDFDHERAALMSKAVAEAQTERDRLFDEAQKAATALSAKRQETLQSEEQSLHQAVGQKVQQEVFAIARKALTDLAQASVEASMVDICVRRLGQLNDKDRGTFIASLKATHCPVVVRTAFDLPPAQRTSTDEAIKKTFGADVQVRFETAVSLIGGIEITSPGQKAAWSIADYLSSLENGVDDLARANGRPKTS